MNAWITNRRAAIGCALLAAGPAMAGVAGTTRVGPLQVQVYDLRPDDGITASASFAQRGVEAGVTALALESFPLQQTQRILYGPWQGTSVDVATPHATAGASVWGGTASGPGGTTMQVGGTVADFAGSQGAFAGFNLQTDLLNQGSYLAFTMTPWSAISFLIPVSAVLTTGHDGDFVDTSVELKLYEEDGERDRWDRFTMSCGGPCQAEGGRLLSVTIDNESDAVFSGRWTMTATMDAVGTVSAVPEPDGWAMLLSGLGAIAALVRRRAPRP